MGILLAWPGHKDRSHGNREDARQDDPQGGLGPALIFRRDSEVLELVRVHCAAEDGIKWGKGKAGNALIALGALPKSWDDSRGRARRPWRAGGRNKER